MNGLYLRKKGLKRLVAPIHPSLEQYGARSDGSDGKYGKGGIVFSVSYRFYKTNKCSNPTLSAIPSSKIFRIL